MRSPMMDVNLQILPAVAASLGMRLWLVMATVPSAIELWLPAPNGMLFLLDASNPSFPEEVAAQSRNNPCYLELKDPRLPGWYK